MGVKRNGRSDGRRFNVRRLFETSSFLAALAHLAGCSFVNVRSSICPRGKLKQSSTAQPLVARHFFDGLLKEKAAVVTVKDDYTLAAMFLGSGAFLCSALPYAAFGLGAVVLLLGVLFFVQTDRVKFVFDGNAFELRTLEGYYLDENEGTQLLEPGENMLVGGKNRWAYSSFVNYEFFPKGLVERGLPPVLVYFKETQTPREEWDKGPGAIANSEGALAQGAVPGMVHFFPAICNAQEIKAEFERHGCKKLP